MGKLRQRRVGGMEDEMETGRRKEGSKVRDEGDNLEGMIAKEEEEVTQDEGRRGD